MTKKRAFGIEGEPSRRHAKIATTRLGHAENEGDDHPVYQYRFRREAVSRAVLKTSRERVRSRGREQPEKTIMFFPKKEG